MPRRPRSRPQLVALEPRDCPAVTLVSEGGPGDGPAMANGASTTMAVSANGKRIAYQTTGSKLVASSLDTNGVLDVFVFDRGTGLNTIASHIGMFAISGQRRIEVGHDQRRRFDGRVHERSDEFRPE